MYEINKGKITCDRKILLSIISLATKEISGISGMTCPFSQKVYNLFTRNTKGGVRIAFKENNVLKVDVYVRVLVGYKVPDIAFRVQENIKNGISSMVDMNATQVNVHVLGVDFEQEENLSLA